jgi:NitT/TauT family transport system substrate-binding protein
MNKKFFLCPVLILIAVSGLAQTVVRVGAFPNITHAQAMVGKANGAFEKALGSGAKIEWTSFNAGPSAIEALFSGAIDMTYVGPNPTISGLRSNGEAVRVMPAEPAVGPPWLCVTIASTPEAFHGKKSWVARWNTQDVALRAWLKANGMKPTDKGGDVQVIPLANPDQLTMFLQKQLDASWAPEPWATRLIHEGNAHLFLDERDLWPDRQFVVTDLIVSPKFLREHPDVVKKWLTAHVELTDWIDGHLPEAKTILNGQIQKETGKALAPTVLDEAFGRLQITYDPLGCSLTISSKSGFEAGFLGKQLPDLSSLYDLSLLNQVLKEKGKKEIQ